MTWWNWKGNKTRILKGFVVFWVLVALVPFCVTGVFMWAVSPTKTMHMFNQGECNMNGVPHKSQQIPLNVWEKRGIQRWRNSYCHLLWHHFFRRFLTWELKLLNLAWHAFYSNFNEWLVLDPLAVLWYFLFRNGNDAMQRPLFQIEILCYTVSEGVLIFEKTKATGRNIIDISDFGVQLAELPTQQTSCALYTWAFRPLSFHGRHP